MNAPAWPYNSMRALVQVLIRLEREYNYSGSAEASQTSRSTGYPRARLRPTAGHPRLGNVGHGTTMTDGGER